jgi:DNA-binding transcriptional ArsR family regulator
MSNSSLKTTMLITKALADRQRIRILMLLRDRELCVCQIIAVLALAPSTVSKHLSILGAAGLVEHRREGRWAYYRLPGGSADAASRSALQWIEASLGRDKTIEIDDRKLAKVLACDPEVLCRQQRRC